MIRRAERADIDDLAGIWLDANIKAHDFIPADYWKAQAGMVKELLALAEVYLYADSGQEICGFIGMNEDHIEGAFVKDGCRSKGVGKALLDYVKTIRGRLTLNVYCKNERARKFYEREGFVAERKGTDPETGEKDLLMVWDLRGNDYGEK